MQSRLIKAQHPAVRDDIGDLVTRRPLPGPRVPQVDPFLFLNHHGPQVYAPNNHGLPFGPHPHRGFETVTFILEGSLSHSDTGGHESIIHAGGVQWMTAGRGLVHAELSPDEFKRAGGPMEILQLWVNLPSRLKMTPPRYIGLQRDQIPTFQLGDGRVTMSLIAGECEEQKGAIAPLLDIMMSTVAFNAGGEWRGVVSPERNVFLYVVRGSLAINGTPIREHHLVEFDTVGEQITITAQSDAFILFGHAEPLREPVVAHGPFVMNTREEITQAIRDYQAGKFWLERVTGDA
jgi:redox-sensitive bicupin YhaK (pirin superfamily)